MATSISRKQGGGTVTEPEEETVEWADVSLAEGNTGEVTMPKGTYNVSMSGGRGGISSGSYEGQFFTGYGGNGGSIKFTMTLEKTVTMAYTTGATADMYTTGDYGPGAGWANNGGSTTFNGITCTGSHGGYHTTNYGDGSSVDGGAGSVDYSNPTYPISDVSTGTDSSGYLKITRVTAS